MPSDDPRTDLFDRIDARTVLESVPRAVIVVDPDGVIRFWNREAESVYGWSASEVLGRPATELMIPRSGVPEHRERLATVTAGEVVQGDRTVLRRDGSTMQVVSFSAPLRDEVGVVVGAVSISGDVTSQRAAEAEIRSLNEHLRLALDAGRLGTWRWEMASGLTEWDEALEAIFGLAPGTFDGTMETYVGAIHPDDRQTLLDAVEGALATSGRYRVDHRIVRPDGTTRWVTCSGVVTTDDDGRPTGTIGCVDDVSDVMERQLELERVAAENEAGLERERVLRQRFEFLARVNEALNDARDVVAIAEQVATVAVPRLGERCEFDIDVNGIEPVVVVVPLGSEVAPGHAVLEVPLVKQGRRLGIMRLSRSAAFGEDDRSLCDLVAVRVAASIENRRLVELHRDTAHALQQALLPGELPEIDGIDLAVGYWPAGEGLQVGGDFYDVFAAADDRWALVVGDVCGTGAFAASVTGLARHALREAVWHGDRPAEVLRSLNRSILRSGFSTFCTAVYAELDTSSGVALSVTIGGHPRPIRTDGTTAEPVGAPGTLLGMLSATTSVTVDVAVAPGEVVVFYTDGATDLPPPDGLLEEEMVDLVRAAAAGATTAAEVAAGIQRRLDERRSFQRRDDDVAVLVLRRRDREGA